MALAQRSGAIQTALWVGLVFAALIIPVFDFRHYIQDGGKFPKGALAELGLKEGDMGEKKAGMLPYVALAAGAAVVLLANWFFQLPALNKTIPPRTECLRRDFYCANFQSYSLLSLDQIRLSSASIFAAIGGCTASRFNTLFGG